MCSEHISKLTSICHCIYLIKSQLLMSTEIIETAWEFKRQAIIPHKFTSHLQFTSSRYIKGQFQHKIGHQATSPAPSTSRYLQGNNSISHKVHLFIMLCSNSNIIVNSRENCSRQELFTCISFCI